MSSNTLKAWADRAGVYAMDANAEFRVMYDAPASTRDGAIFDRLVTSVTAPQELYRFTGMKGVPAVQLWKGRVDHGGVDDWTVAIQSYEYQSGTTVRYKDWVQQRNTHDLFADITPQMANRARRNRFALLGNAINNNTLTGSDGVVLFSDSHEFGDNNITVTVTDTTNPTDADMIYAINKVREQFATFTSDQGNLINESVDDAFLLVVAKTGYFGNLKQAARRQMIAVNNAAASDSVGGSVSNIEPGTFDVWNSTRLSSAFTGFYAFLVEPGQGPGNAPVFLRTEVLPYDIAVGGPDGNNTEFQQLRQMSTSLYGMEGIGVINAAKAMKVTLST